MLQSDLPRFLGPGIFLGPFCLFLGLFGLFPGTVSHLFRWWRVQSWRRFVWPLIYLVVACSTMALICVADVSLFLGAELLLGRTGVLSNLSWLHWLASNDLGGLSYTQTLPRPFKEQNRSGISSNSEPQVPNTEVSMAR